MPAKGNDLAHAEIRLYHRLHRRVALTTRDVKLAGEVRRIYAVSDPDTIAMEAVTQRGGALPSNSRVNVTATQHEPYWAQHWPSAYQMESDLDELVRLHTPSGLGHPRILELGCGGGILSLGLALRGYQALATDNAPQALMLTKLSGYANKIEIATQLLDWRRPRLRHCYDIVVAADIAYDRSVFAALDHCLRAAMTNDGMAIIAEPFRSMGDDFIEYLLAHGWFLQVREATQAAPKNTKNRCRYLILRKLK